MTQKTIATDNPLDPSRRAVLEALLDHVLPASRDARMPAASTLDLPARFARASESVLSVVFRELDALNDAAVAAQGRPFAVLDVAARDALLATLRDENPVFLRRTVLEAVTYYYEHDRVLEALGLEPRAPYPKGHTVHAGDLSLLDPVRARGKIWRDAPR